MGSSRRLFEFYSRRYATLVETGTWSGQGIQAALDAGFERVMSCDVNPACVESAQRRFADSPVEVVHGASRDALPALISQLQGPAAFFLDAHAMPPSESATDFAVETLLEDHEDDPDLQSPLISEIEIVLTRAPAGSTILVDDRQCFGTWMFHGLLEETVRALVREHDEEYVFSYYGNVLCCCPSNVGAPRRTFVARVAERLEARGIRLL